MSVCCACTGVDTRSPTTRAFSLSRTARFSTYAIGTSRVASISSVSTVPGAIGLSATRSFTGAPPDASCSKRRMYT